MDISRILTISTEHITEETSKLLAVEPDTNEIGLSVYQKADYGWFIHVPEYVRELEDTSCPADLYKCMFYAHENGCEWLCLDSDGETVDELKKYEW